MKNINDVIKQKEREIQQKKQEIHQLESDVEILRAAARLLGDDGDVIPARSTAQTIAAVVAARPGNGEVKQFP